MAIAGCLILMCSLGEMRTLHSQVNVLSDRCAVVPRAREFVWTIFVGGWIQFMFCAARVVMFVGKELQLL